MAEIASCRGSGVAVGIGSVGTSITTVAVPSRVTSCESGGPASGKRSACRTAEPTSPISTRGAGGRSTTPSSGTSIRAMRDPRRSGICCTRGYVARFAVAAVAPSTTKTPPVT